MSRKTKHELSVELSEARDASRREALLREHLERRLKMAITELTFWRSQAVDYSEQVAFWQRKNHEIIEQMFKETTDLDLREYARSISDAIIAARPDPSAIAAVIATADKSVQGAFSPSPRRDTAKLVHIDHRSDQ